MTQKKRVLITVKTYPHPSKTMNETVCTAGVTEDGQWIRLYPIPYRYLQGSKQFNVFDWIEADVTKRPYSKDHRPESYSIECDTIKKVGHLDSQKDASARYGIISKLLCRSYEDAVEIHKAEGKSLTAFRPKKMLGLHFDKVSQDWTEDQKRQLNQISLFDNASEHQPLRKVPYAIRCHFICDEPNCKGHKILLTSWEYNWTFLKLCDQYKQDEKKAIEELQNRWMKQFDDNKLGYLILGTPFDKDRFHTFIVIGHCSFNKDVVYGGEQMTFL